MRELRLQLLQPPQRALPLGEVAQKAGEETMSICLYFSDRQFDRKGRAVLALSRDDPAEADDPPLAGREVAGDCRGLPDTATASKC